MRAAGQRLRSSCSNDRVEKTRKEPARSGRRSRLAGLIETARRIGERAAGEAEAADRNRRLLQVPARYDVATSRVQALPDCHRWWGTLVCEELQHERWGRQPAPTVRGRVRAAGRTAPCQRRSASFRPLRMFAFGVHWSDFVALGDNGPLTPVGRARMPDAVRAQGRFSRRRRLGHGRPARHRIVLGGGRGRHHCAAPGGAHGGR